MLNMKKRILVLIMSVLVLMSTVPVSAAIEDFEFYVYNTGQSFTPNFYGNGNTKSYAGQAWCVNVNNISFSSGYKGAGMAYILYRGSKQASAICWKTASGAKKGYWGNYDGAKGYTYYLYGRMDDDLSGSCISSGQWNSDTINGWF